ncbi:MAG TPA: adenylate/guanylate cyclase domain-containing protein [Chitinophagaceae bacterium]|nr:adenylate/guanylate cyclase domain-containing protein [Chitinophagaceae bacterium]
MTKKTFCLFSIFITFASFIYAQLPVIEENEKDTAYINSLIKQGWAIWQTEPDKTIALSTRARELSEKIDFLSGVAYAYKNIGIANYIKGNYVETLNSWNESLKVFEQLNDQTGISNMLSNMAAVYGEQGNEEKGLEYSLRSLAIAEKLGNKLRIYSALNAIGSIYYQKAATKSKALEYLIPALPLCVELGDSSALGTISENIGEIYMYFGKYDSAKYYYEKSISAFPKNNANASFAYNGLGKLSKRVGKFDEAFRYHNKAYEIAKSLESKPHMVKSLDGVGNVYDTLKNYRAALDYFLRASSIAEEIDARPDMKDLYQEIAITYSNLRDYKNAYKYHELYATLKDTLYNTEIDKKLGRLQLQFDLDKKEGEITLLEKDNALTDQKLKRQQLFKNAFMIGLLLAFTIALLIFRSYRIKTKTHKILDQQKNEIENLLLNILPTEVAHELKTTGHSTPRQYESVSVMFTDFKGFTTIADKMAPDDLVKELDACFIAFDGIIEKYKLEKIKTIGDSYMCAGGIPTPDDQHVLKIVKAGLEIQQYVNEYNKRRHEKGMEPWLVRIGIHVGPVVAGVVGKKKYAYDIWGSTVNIASRMESNGEPGKVNISSATHELIKDYYECSYRGKISAKNIGEIDMYFIEHEYTIPKKLLLNERKEIVQ